MQPELAGVAVRRTLLAVAVNLTDGRVDVDEHHRVARPGTGLPRAGWRSVTASSWRMCPNVRLRSQVPTVEAETVS
jgi:hypothetical protein